MMRACMVALLLFGACKPESARRADRAAKEVIEQRDDLAKADNPRKVVQEAKELAAAGVEFLERRRTRILAVRGQYEVIASQPLLISTMAQSFTITDASRGEINEKLALFQARLAETANLIEGLERADVDVWEKRDDEVRAALERLEDAREAAWEALDDAPSTDRSAS